MFCKSAATAHSRTVTKLCCLGRFGISREAWEQCWTVLALLATSVPFDFFPFIQNELDDFYRTIIPRQKIHFLFFHRMRNTGKRKMATHKWKVSHLQLAFKLSRRLPLRWLLRKNINIYSFSVWLIEFLKVSELRKQLPRCKMLSMKQVIKKWNYLEDKNPL